VINEAFIFYFFIGGILILSLLAISLSILLIGFQRKQTRHKSELLKLRLDVQEEAMSLISEELHDNVGQLLSLSRIHAQAISAGTKQLPINTTAKNLYELLSRAVTDLRFISHSLNSGLMKEIGLRASLQRELEYMYSAAGIEGRMMVWGEKYNFTQEKNLLLFRILQEVIQNVLKHAAASRFIILICYKPGEVCFRIKDDGVGFDDRQILESNSLGLKNITNRVRLLQGTIVFKSEPGKGTQIMLDIPIWKF